MSSEPSALTRREFLHATALAGGGLLVAVVQLAIALGATLGGLAYDASGYRATFAVSAAALCASALVALLAWRQRPVDGSHTAN